MTKILIHSNAPHTRTGYGVQCAQLAARLNRAGHDIAVSSTYGQQGGMGTWRTPDGGTVPIYPCGYDGNGNDVLHNHALHHFDGDPLGGWIIPLIDLWVLINPVLADFNVAGWCPVDHFPVPPDVLKFFHRTGAVPLAMSRYGEKLLFESGLDPVYIPLSVDTKTYKPTPTITINDKTVTAREMLGVPREAFLVGMVAMNKGWARDRKGFNEALRAFGVFWRQHQDAVLYIHTDWVGQGTEGINLKELAIHAGVPEHALKFPELYAYWPHGFTPEQMAATYTAFDVLLSPSHGEGFCVPLIEAQACGTPVIATDFSAQTELVGAGWRISGQPEWDPAQKASYIVPFIEHIVDLLEDAYKADLVGMQAEAVAFASRYDTDRVFVEHWKPFLDSLEVVDTLPLDRKPITDYTDVAVVVPAMKRPENVARLVTSLHATAAKVKAYFVCDYDDLDEINAVIAAGAEVIISDRGQSYAQKVNSALRQTGEPWLLVVGDDVEFHPGWLDAAARLSDRFDVIGTNDSLPGRVRNPDVANGSHADHFFLRRAYIDEYGACLNGPGVAAPECYTHWFTDKEIIGLAQARGVFAPCLDSVVEHHHPGYDGREDLRAADPVYLKGQAGAEQDKAEYLARRPLIEMQRTGRGKRR